MGGKELYSTGLVSMRASELDSFVTVLPARSTWCAWVLVCVCASLVCVHVCGRGEEEEEEEREEIERGREHTFLVIFLFWRTFAEPPPVEKTR